MNRPSPVVQALMLSIGATATAYRIFHNLGISLALGCGLGVLAAALTTDERRRDEERRTIEEERKRQQKAQAEKPAE